MSSKEDIYQEKVDRMVKAVRMEKIDRVPIMLDFESSYMVEFAGFDYLDATWNYDRIIEAYGATLKEFDCDANLGQEYKSPKLSYILGGRSWVQNTTNGYMQHPEVMSLAEEDYDLFITDPIKCIIDKILPRIYQEMEKPYPYNMNALLKALMHYNTEIYDFYYKLFEKSYEHASPIYYGGIFYAPFDLLADHLRGIKGVLLDIRRRPELVVKACEVIMELMLKYIRKTFPVNSEGFPFASCWVHLPPMINDKQFETFFWPTFKKICDTLAGEGYNLYIQFQGDYTSCRYFDYLNELPEKQTIIAIEKCDLKNVKTRLGEKHCITASFPSRYFGVKTKQEIVNMVKEYLDIGAPGGGFVFNLDRPALSFLDAKPENIKAAIECVKEYGIY